MRSHDTRYRCWCGLLVAALLAGCSPTPVMFDGPPGTVLFVDGKPYHLPSSVEFMRPAGTGQSNRYNVSLAYNTPTGDVHAQGHIDVYGYTESDVDKMVANTCKFEDSQLANLAAGQTLIYKAKTASKQPLFDLTLAKK